MNDLLLDCNILFSYSVFLYSLYSLNLIDFNNWPYALLTVGLFYASYTATSLILNLYSMDKQEKEEQRHNLALKLESEKMDNIVKNIIKMHKNSKPTVNKSENAFGLDIDGWRVVNGIFDKNKNKRYSHRSHTIEFYNRRDYGTGTYF